MINSAGEALDLEAQPVAMPVGEQVIEWTGLGWEGYETILEVRGESRRPKMVYLDGDLTLISRDFARLDGDQVVELSDVSWEGYERLLQLGESSSAPRLLYLDGNLTMMAPSHIHELWVDRLGTFVREMVIELEIPCIPTRETLFKRGRDEGGVQPDDSFYFANRGPIAAKGRKVEIDLLIDPPPDLAIEFVHTHGGTGAVEVLRRLGVPEVWVGDEDRLRFLTLDETGQYREAERSLVFPFLTASEVFGWIARTDLELLSDWARALRRWIAEVVVPRIHPG